MVYKLHRIAVGRYQFKRIFIYFLFKVKVLLSICFWSFKSHFKFKLKDNKIFNTVIDIY